jgi:uncharacterized membrane protein (UPF0127 family)
MNANRLLLALAAAGFAAGLAAAAQAQSAPPGAAVRPDAALEFIRPDGAVAARLVVEIAEAPEDRALGLMGRRLRDYLAGMLFVFEQAETQTFWMRNTPTSLDIIFVDAGQRVLNIAAGTTPMSDQTYVSAGPARYVVEAVAGFAMRYGIRRGYAVRWSRFQQQ